MNDQHRNDAKSGSSRGSPRGEGVAEQVKQAAGEAREGATDKAGEMYDDAKEWARGAYDEAAGWASDAYRTHGRRSIRGMRSAGSGIQRYVAENPVMVEIVGLAAGLLIGALLPRTRREDEAFGEWADEVREQSLRYAHEAAQRGREFVEESFSGDGPGSREGESERRQGRRTANRH